jgi:glutamyl-tRNA synthetase
MSTMVTRFAPSPTGFLHVGGARTAIFSWLLAKRNQGRFVLRVEDTDRQRSTPEATQAILDGLTWLGLDWDDLEYQSQRSELHNEYIDKLLESGQAYWCDCSPEQVDAMREKAREEGRKPKYDGSCRDRNLGPGEGRVVRLKAPLTGSTDYLDMVKGHISWPNEEMDDMILRRSDGSPTYNLAVVVDDHTMGITHVLRGEDHVANTPRQILIYNALGLTPPAFGHVPMILGPDKKKLSKRHGATSVIEYEREGILPEAMLNYLTRLGWSHGDQEIFSKEQLIECFNTDSLGTSAAVFDTTKLHWLNAQYIKEADPQRIAKLLQPILAEQGVPCEDAEAIAALVPMYAPRSKTLVEMAQGLDFFLVDDDKLEYQPKAVRKFLKEESKVHLKAIRDGLAALDEFSEESIDAVLTGYLEANDLKFKAIAQPIRVAVTGRTQSPGLHETMLGLGREKTLTRMDRALTILPEEPAQ